MTARLYARTAHANRATPLVARSSLFDPAWLIGWRRLNRQSTFVIRHSPAPRRVLDLLVEPLLERREVVERSRSRPSPACRSTLRARPATAGSGPSRASRPVCARLLVVVDRAAVAAGPCIPPPATARDGTGTAGCRQEVAHVGHVRRRRGTSRPDRNPLRRGPSGGAMPWYFRRSSHQASLYLVGRDLSREDLPAPLVDQQTEWQEGDLVERSREQQADVARRRRGLVEQADLHQVLRRDRQRDGVADGFVEAVVGAVAEERRQRVVGALIEVVAQLVVDRQEVLFRRSRGRP